MTARAPAPLLGTVLGLAAVLLGTSGAAAEKGDLTVEQVEYQGWAHNLRLHNGDAELIVTLDVGPRVISYRLDGGKNVFKNYEDQLGGTGEPEWMIRGGHRLWAAPEDTTRTYAPDNGPVTWQPIGPGTVRLTPRPEAAYGLQKEIDVRLEPSGSRATLVHRIRNVGPQPTDLAPWALTVMAPGGVEVIPLPPKRPHPGSPKNARSPAEFAPDQHYALWPYTDFRDPRWTFGSSAITLRQDAGRGPDEARPGPSARAGSATSTGAPCSSSGSPTRTVRRIPTAGAATRRSPTRTWWRSSRWAPWSGSPRARPSSTPSAGS
jgi:hypothetical protein